MCGVGPELFEPVEVQVEEEPPASDPEAPVAMEATRQVDTQVLGPGAFQELDLAAAFAPVTAWSQTVLLNNSELGKISWEQRSAGLPVWATSLHNPNFSAYAKTAGPWAPGWRRLPSWRRTCTGRCSTTGRRWWR